MSDKVKPILVTRSSLPPYEEFAEMIKPIWESAWLTNMGDFHQTLEARLKGFMDTDNLVLFVNGHMALEMVLQALELTGEVITTPFSFASTTHAIVRNGLTPVFCDIDPENYTIDADKIEALITEKTSAIVPVHVYGHICDVDKIAAIAKKYNLKVVYDAAHTFGEALNGVGVANFGDASIFSFHATKVYHTIEGGAVTYQEEGLKSRLTCLKNFGIIDQDTVIQVGGNAKMNEFQAVMGICNLNHLEEEIEKRRIVTEHYLERLSGVKGLVMPKDQPGVKKNYAYFPVLFDGFPKTRDEMYRLLAREEIYARKYFYPLINDFDCYKDQYSSEDTPVAKRIAEQVMTLPCYASLTVEDVDRVCDAILRYAK